ncbi:MFS transporter [Actinomadura montaniterrae]|uniref:MFS transporter n=1 Tax=Actinomadura montaniterrae TaxID=1803903 RepID=A0A6L3VGZ5_9ACTN|nr:MFS transporter [Actinomadura montaniterrae]KAB2360220.1 MFS transporter [Actinomadura montaniterrae]
MTERLPRPVRALIGVRVINQLGAYVMSFLAVLAGPDLASAALAVFGVAALASRWIGGTLLDRLAPRTVVVLGLASTGAALLVLALAHGPPQTLGAVALVGLAFELCEPATQEALARAAPPGRHGDVYGLLGTSLVAAGAVGGLLAAVLLPFGARWLAVADAATCLAAAAVALAFLPREPVRPPVRDAAWRPSRRLVRLTLAGTAFAAGYLAVLMYMPFVLLQRGAPAWLPGLVLTGAAVLAPLTGRLGRRALDRPSHERVLAAGTGALALAALVLAVGRAVPVTVAAYLAWAVADSVLQGRWQALIASIAPEAERPRWFAFFGSSWGVAQPAVPGLAALAGGAMPVAFLAFLAVPLTLRRPKPKPDSGPVPVAAEPATVPEAVADPS